MHDEAFQIAVGDRSGLQVGFQQRLVTKGGLLVDLFPVGGEVDAAGAEPSLELRKQVFSVRAWQIHFIDKEKGGDAVLLQ